MDANKVLSKTQTVAEQVSDHIRNCAKLLHEREGEFLTVNEAITLFSDECEISEELASKVLTKLVADTVDPVIRVNHEGQKLVGVVDFHEYDGAYGYTNFHDQFGQGKRVVCQQCVNDSVTDADVTHATEGDVNGSFENGASWDELVNAIHQHYRNAHTVSPESVDTSVEATGATLVSGTTIGGGTAVHEGFTSAANISISGDADTIDTFDVAKNGTDGTGVINFKT